MSLSKGANVDPGEIVELVYTQVIEYMSGDPHTALPKLIELASGSDLPLETLAAVADATLERLAVALVEGFGKPAALEYARGMLLHNQLTRIERGA